MLSRRSGIEQVARPGEYRVEHLCGESPGLGVVAAAVVRIEQHTLARKHVAGAVGKSSLRRFDARRAQHGGMGNATQRDDDSHSRQRGELSGQVGIAQPDLVRQRLVGWRQTLDCVRDPAVAQPQAVTRGQGFGAARKTVRMQRAVEQDAGVIAGKRSPGAIGAMQSRRQTNDQQPMTLASKRRNRPAVVAGMSLAHRLEKAGQPAAAAAIRIEESSDLAHGWLQRPLNCASSVDPCIAVIDDVPDATVCVTSSK